MISSNFPSNRSWCLLLAGCLLGGAWPWGGVSAPRGVCSRWGLLPGGGGVACLVWGVVSGPGGCLVWGVCSGGVCSGGVCSWWGCLPEGLPGPGGGVLLPEGCLVRGGSASVPSGIPPPCEQDDKHGAKILPWPQLRFGR